MVKVNGKDIQWEDPPKGHYLTAVKFHVLWKDEHTGAQLVLAKVPQGQVHEYAHRHPDANQWGFVLSGEAQLPNGNTMSVSEDNYRFSNYAKGQQHGGHLSVPEGTKYTKDIVMLHFWDGPLTKVFE